MRTPTLLTRVALFLAVGAVGVHAAPTAVDDTGSTPANMVLTVPAPGVLSNDTSSEGTLTVQGSVPQQIYSFAGISFDQLSTPNVMTLLSAGTYSNAVVTAVPTTATDSITGFPTDPTSFNDGLTLGRLAQGGTGVRALNLPGGNQGNLNRSGVELTWNNGITVTNLAGFDFVVYESGTAGSPEAFMVQVRNAADGIWSPWVYNSASASGATSDGVFFATRFDLDTFGIAVNARINGIRVANMTDEDRMVNASGQGQVLADDAGATSAFVPAPGPFGSGEAYLNGGLDPDPVYVGILRPMSPGGAAFDANSVLGASVNVNMDGSYTYNPTNVLQFQQLGSGQSVMDSFNYRVQDQSGGSENFDNGTVVITVNGVNDAPTGGDDSYTIDEDSVLAVSPANGVLGNDTDVDTGTTLNVTTFDSASARGATVSMAADGSFDYDPTAVTALQALAVGQTLTDTFSYTVSDGEATDTVTVTITITGRNDAPTAMNDSYATTANTVLNVSAPGVLSNDTDPDTTDVLRVEAPGAQFYTFAGVTFDQAGTPTVLTTLAPGTYDAAVIDEVPEDTTSPRTGFPDDATNFRGAYSLGNLLNSTSSGVSVSGINLPLSAQGTERRAGVELTWANGLSLTNLTGGDFVIYESGSASAPEGYMVQVRGTDSGFWSRWVYIPASAVDGYGEPDEFLFATVFNLDDFGISANDRINAFRIANLIDADRMETGTSFVLPEDNGNSPRPSPGSLASFPEYSTGTYDPDPLYLGVLHQTSPTGSAYDSVSAQGATVVVNADGSFSYDPTTSPTLSVLPLGVTMDDTFTYTATDGFGGFSTATVTVTVTGVNSPPTVAITFPTNNSTFFSPATFTITADASDTDGTITQVEFRETISNTSLFTDTTAPYSVDISALAPGTYTYVAIATDDDMATTTSASVTITVSENPPFVAGGISSSGSYFLQSGMMTQSVTVNNPSPIPIQAVRLAIQGLAPGIVVYNATGTNLASEPYVQHNFPVPAGGSVTFFIEYFVANRTTIPAPTFVATLQPVDPPVTPVGTVVNLSPRPPGLQVPPGNAGPVIMDGGHVLIDYPTVSGRTYFIQYSTDLATWSTVVPSQTGTGSTRQWIDSGPPKTPSHPSTVVGGRFYRAIEVP